MRELPLNEEEVMVEFDLAYSKLNEKRVERLWVDLIFEGPEMNQVILRDVTFSRRPRADLPPWLSVGLARTRASAR